MLDEMEKQVKEMLKIHEELQKSKFKIGDRVAVYQNGFRVICTVIQIEDVLIHVQREEDKNTWIVHPKQCRKLVKKEVNFKIGDKVKVYGGLAYMDAIGILDGQLATVLETQDPAREEFPEAILVIFKQSMDGTYRFFVHPYQCRKI